MMDEKKWNNWAYLCKNGLIEAQDLEDNAYGLPLGCVPSAVALAKDYIESVLGGVQAENGNCFGVIFNLHEGYQEVAQKPICYNVEDMDYELRLYMPDIFRFGYKEGAIGVRFFKCMDEAQEMIKKYGADTCEDFTLYERESPELFEARRHEFLRIMKLIRQL